MIYKLFTSTDSHKVATISIQDNYRYLNIHCFNTDIKGYDSCWDGYMPGIWDTPLHVISNQLARYLLKNTHKNIDHRLYILAKEELGL